MHPGYGADKHYQIIRQPAAESKIKHFQIPDQILSALDENIDWALSRNPHKFTALGGDVYMWVTQDFLEFNIPSIEVYYHIDNEALIVTIVSIDINANLSL